MPRVDSERYRVGPAGRGIVQIHPTRRCNLRCRHCYSSSGPDVRAALPAALLAGAVRDAAAEGYDVLAVSGGEPFLYDGLVPVLSAAKAAGMSCTLTTNGLLTTRARLAAVAGLVDGIAVSLDGVPASHDDLRGRAGAFEGMRSRLGLLRDSGIPFGFVFTLTQHNVDQVEWVAEFASAEGAALLQVHPLEIEGAAAALDGTSPDELELAVARMEGGRLAERHGLLVQVDAVARPELAATPERFLAEPAAAGAPLAHLVTPLVVETSGRVVPLRYGFNDAYALGSVHDRPLRDLAGAWREDGYGRLLGLCAEVHEELTGPGGPSFVNWYERLARAADVRETACVPLSPTTD